MGQAFLMNVIGAILLGVAILLHIICMATPNMAGFDFGSVIKALIRATQGMRDRFAGVDTYNRLADLEIMYGPWKVCQEVRSVQSTCNSWKSGAPGWIKAAQAFSLMGTLAGIAALIISVISLVMLRKGSWKKLFPLLVCLAAIAAGVCVLVEDIIIAAKYESMPPHFFPLRLDPRWGDIMSEGTYLGWGFGLDIVAAILLIVAGLIHLLGGRAATREGVV